jgi:hypothetical protein
MQPRLEVSLRPFLLFHLLIRRRRLARLWGSCEQLPALRRQTDTSLNCDQACRNIIYKTHAQLRRMHRHATGQDKPANSESGCCRDEAEAIGLASHFKLSVDNSAAKYAMD